MVLKKVLVILLGHFAPPLLTWRPGNYAPLAPRRYAPGVHTFTSHVSLGAISVAANACCSNAMSNRPETPN